LPGRPGWECGLLSHRCQLYGIRERLNCYRFNDDEDALRIANGTKYSLAAGVWSADVGRIHRFVRRLKAGTVWANTFGPTDVRLPWGGARDSGFGREHGDEAIANFTEPKAVWINIGK